MEPERLVHEGEVPSVEEVGPKLRPARLRPAGWALGLPALILLAAVAAMRVSPAIEINIRREAVKLAQGDASAPVLKAGTRIVVAGRDVTIVSDGELPDEVGRDIKTRAAVLPAVRWVGHEVTGYVALSPFPFRIRRTDAGIELSGAVPTPELRQRLVAQAEAFVTADQVDDRLRVAAGAPDGFAAAAQHLLGVIGPVEPAEASLSDRRVQVTARPRDSVSYNLLMAATRALPAGYVLGEPEILPPRIEPYVWTARRDGGGLSLGGAVPSEALRAAVIRLARDMLPELPVRDAMQTARGLERSVDFMEAARAAFGTLGRLQSGEAQIVARRFTLTGETVVKGGRDAIEKGLRETVPQGLGAPHVEVTVVPASPFIFAAKRAAGRIELSGYLSSDEDRITATTLTAVRFPGERTVDRTLVVEGAPAGFPDVLKTALSALSDFAEGEASVRDKSLTYSGRIIYGQLAARARRTLPGQVPEGWTARVELEPVRPSGALDAYLCADLLGDSTRKTPIKFPSGEAPATGPALDAAAEIVRRCGQVGIRVVQHVKAGADPAAARDLAIVRARALVAALFERGATARFSVDGIVSSSDKDGERTEFLVTPL